MKIDSIMVGPIMTNCYLLSDETAGVCALIDPGDDAARVEQLVRQSGCALKYILLTHGHFDHTSAVRPLLERYPDVPVYIHRKDTAADRGGGEEPAVLSGGRHAAAGRPDHPRAGNAGSLRGLRLPAGGGTARPLRR